MKIDGTLPLPVLDRLQARESAVRPAVGSGGEVAAAPDVAVAGGARFVNETRSLSSVMAEFRGDEVVRARQAVADGSLLSEIELDAAVDALLAGL